MSQSRVLRNVVGGEQVDSAAGRTADPSFGCVWVNTPIPLVAEMPHGGFEHSSHGRDLSLHGSEDHPRIEHVPINAES